VELTIEVSPDIAGKLKSLEQRVNCSMAPAIERELESPVSIEQVAAALVRMGLSGNSSGKILFKRDKITFAVMVAQQQIANNGKYAGEGG